MRILFDADVILAKYSKNGYGRGGIYFVAYQILKEMSGRSDCNVCLYCRGLGYKKFVDSEKWAPMPILIDRLLYELLNKQELLKDKYNNRKRNKKSCPDVNG